MKLWQRFTKSIYKFDEYYELINTSAGSSFLYYVLVSVLTIALTAFILFPVIAEVYDMAEKNIPEFEIKDGRLETDDVIDLNSSGTVIKADASADSVDELVSEADEDYIQGIFVSGTEILVESELTDMNSRTDLEDFEGLTDDNLKAFLNIIRYVSYVIMIIFLILSRLVLLLLLWCIAKLMSNLLRGGLGFKDSLNLGIYASTTASLLKAVLMIFGVSMHNYIFFGIVLAYMYFGLDSCKKHKAEPGQEII